MNPNQIEMIEFYIKYCHIFFISLGIIKAIDFLMGAFVLEEKDVPCWTQIMPFYSDYVWFKTFWKPLYFFIILGQFIFIYVFSIAGAITLGINQNTATNTLDAYQNTFPMSEILGIILIILVIIFFLSTTIITIMLLHKISKAFNHGAGFTVGLVFLNFIFSIILGVECIKRGVISKISSGRKVFLALWCTLIVLLCVLFSQFYKISMTQALSYMR